MEFTTSPTTSAFTFSVLKLKVSSFTEDRASVSDPQFYNLVDFIGEEEVKGLYSGNLIKLKVVWIFTSWGKCAGFYAISPKIIL